MILGQLTVIIAIALLVRFFIFADPPPDKRDYQSHIRQQRQAKLLPEAEATPSIILEKTYYDVNEHLPESLDWFTLLLGQAIGHLREDARQHNKLLKLINNLLNSDKIPSFVDTINVTDLDIGQDFPVFSNCRILPIHDSANASQTLSSSNYSPFHTRVHQNSRRNLQDPQLDNSILEAQMNLDLSDHVTLGIDTRLLVNFPAPLFAFLPIHLSVSIVKLSGTLKISLHPPPSLDKSEVEYESQAFASDIYPHTASPRINETIRETEKNKNSKPANDGAYLTFSFSPDYELEFEVESLIGSRSQLKNVSKIAMLLESRMRKAFNERCVYPNEQQVSLPSLWPKETKTDIPENPINNTETTAEEAPSLNNVSRVENLEFNTDFLNLPSEPRSTSDNDIADFNEPPLHEPHPRSSFSNEQLYSHRRSFSNIY